MTLTGFAVGLVTLASTFIGQGAASTPNTIPAVLVIDKSAMSAARYVDYTKRESVTEYVKNYFAEIPILAEIAFCESTYRHVNSDGEVLRGDVNSDDLGVMQINTRYHGDRAERLGIDLHTLEGNLKYAKYLYEREGVQPWRASSKCWMKTEAYKISSEA